MTSTVTPLPAATLPFQQQIDEFIAQQVSRLPAELLDDLTSPIQELIESGAAEKALQEGAKAPDFTLPDEHGQPVTLSQLLTQGPVVMTFYRGIWCNFCNLEMRAYQQVLPALQALGASIIAISPQQQEHCLALTDKNTLTFPILSDSSNKVAHQFGLVFTINERAQKAHNRVRKDLPRFNGDDSWEIPIPATYLIDQSGTIRLAYVDPDFMQRLDPATVVARIKEL